MALTWIPRKNGACAPNAVLAGRDSGKDLFVVRAPHNGGVVPGKLHMGMRYAHISYGFKEHLKTEYEVLTAPQGSCKWVHAANGYVPPNSVVGGRDPLGDLYYIGRVVHQNTVTVGKIHTRYQSCYVPYDGKEFQYMEYEVLVYQ